MKQSGFWSAAITLSIFAVLGTLQWKYDHSVTRTPAQTQAPACPASDAASIKAWRDGLVATVNNDSAGVTAAIKQCFPTQAQTPACAVRLRSYLNRGNGSDIQDADISSNPHRRVPDELLISGGSDFNYVLRGDIENHAKELGWPVARYKSRHSGGFDGETPNLLMIEVPGAQLNPPVTFDRFINISMEKDRNERGRRPTPRRDFPSPEELDSNSSDYPSIFTMVTVEHANRDSRAHLYFQMFDRSGHVYRPRSPSNPNGCVSCHPSGLRAISPLGYHVRKGERQLEPDNWNQVKRINNDMATGQRGGITWGSRTEANGDVTPVLDTNSGPVIGPSEPFSENTRTQEFIVGADGNSGCQKSREEISVTDIFDRAPGRNNVYKFKSSPPVDWQKVADAMDCQMCHNNERQGVLNGLTSSAEIDFKILVDQSMPFGAHKNPLDQGNDPDVPVVDDLNPNERIALANCLQAEWSQERGHLLDWLKEPSCGN